MQFADFTVRQTKSFSNLSKCSLSLKRASEKNEIWPEISASPQCSTWQRFYIEFDKDNSSTFSVLNLEKWSFCMIWCHLHNLKNGENCHRGVLLLLKLILLRGCFSRFLNIPNGTKSCNASHMQKSNLCLESANQCHDKRILCKRHNITLCKHLLYLQQIKLIRH